MIENETQNEIDEFLKTASEFNKVNMVATSQKKENQYDEQFDDITNEGDRRQTKDDGINTEDIFIDDNYLFDSDNAQETKNLCDYVLDDVDQNDMFLSSSSQTTPQTTPPQQNLYERFQIFCCQKQEQGKASQKNSKKVPKTKAEQGDGEKSREKSPSRSKNGQIYAN